MYFEQDFYQEINNDIRDQEKLQNGCIFALCYALVCSQRGN